ARLQQRLLRTELQAEQQREAIVNLTVELAVGYGREGETFLALLYLAEALKLDEGHPERLAAYRERIRELLSGSPQLVQLRNLAEPVVGVSFLARGCWAVTADGAGGVRVWDLASGEAVGVGLKGPAAVMQAEVSPDGRLLATADAAGGVRVWELRTAAPRTPPLPQGRPVGRLTFNPDGRVLLSQRDDGLVQLWETTNGRRIPLPGLGDALPPCGAG